MPEGTTSSDGTRNRLKLRRDVNGAAIIVVEDWATHLVASRSLLAIEETITRLELILLDIIAAPSEIVVDASWQVVWIVLYQMLLEPLGSTCIATKTDH
jgi:hypothetical protein